MEVTLNEEEIKEAIVYFLYHKGLSDNVVESDVQFAVLYPEADDKANLEEEGCAEPYFVAIVGGEMEVNLRE